jgi:flagellar protein FliS
MSANPYASRVSEYTRVSAHAGVAAADSHKLILMLMDGALDRIAQARVCIRHQDIAQKAQLIHRVVCILGELRASLDLKAGGPTAANLDSLYDYMIQKLLQGSLRNSQEDLQEVSTLLRDIRDAWVQVPGKLQETAR